MGQVEAEDRGKKCKTESIKKAVLGFSAMYIAFLLTYEVESQLCGPALGVHTQHEQTAFYSI